MVMRRAQAACIVEAWGGEAAVPSRQATDSPTLSVELDTVASVSMSRLIRTLLVMSYCCLRSHFPSMQSHIAPAVILARSLHATQ